MPWYSVREPHPRNRVTDYGHKANAMSCFFPIIIILCFLYTAILYGLHVVDCMHAHYQKYIHRAASCHDIRRKEYSLAFWPSTDRASLFRHRFLAVYYLWSSFPTRKFTYVTLIIDLSSYFIHGPRIKIIGQLITHRRHRGAGFYSLRFSLLLTDLPFHFARGEWG